MTSDALDITEGSRVIVTDWTGGEHEGTVTGVGTTADGLMMSYTVRVLHDYTCDESFDAEHIEIDSDPAILDTHDAAQLRNELREIVAGPYADTAGLGSDNPEFRLRAATRAATIASQLAWEEINALQDAKASVGSDPAE